MGAASELTPVLSLFIIVVVIIAIIIIIHSLFQVVEMVHGGGSTANI